MLGIDHAEEERQQGKGERAIYTYATPESEPNRNGNFWHLRNLIQGSFCECNIFQPTSSTARLIAKRKAAQEEKAAVAAAAASSPFGSDFRPSIRQVTFKYNNDSSILLQ